jgi:hypothetical protein
VRVRRWRGEPRPLAGRGVALALALAVWAPAVLAEGWDFLTTEGKLSTEDFYRLVSCRAMPGGPCEGEIVRWSYAMAANLRVGFAPVPPDYPRPMARVMESALEQVIAEINAAGSAVRLVRGEKKERLQIVIHLTPVSEGEPIRGTGVDGVDGEVLGAALVTVWWDAHNRLTEAVIVMAEDIPERDVVPVMLEEVVQGLGLLTDIRNPHYLGRSVFSEDSNSARVLAPQDRLALQMHYPPRERPEAGATAQE